MSLSDAQMQHPKFMRFSNIANDVVPDALKRAGLDADKLQDIDVHTGRVVDDITALMIRVDKMTPAPAGQLQTLSD